ncbi:DNA polymerase IV [Kaarinaea lacus]
MIIHADMDAFYVSVELLDKPHLADKPVAVGGPSKTRGVISAANYIAREYGVHSALPCAIATRRCPNLILLKPRMSLYADYSQKIKDIFFRYTPIIEPLALDEAFLDTSASEKLFGPTEVIGKIIQQEINDELGLIASIGVAPNKFIAKIASDIEKPNGFVVVQEHEKQAFLDPLPITRIWGIGTVSAARLHKQGVKTIKDIRQLTETLLLDWFGKHGTHLWQLAHGVDNREVVTDSQAKSISHETTFDTNLTSMEAIQSELLHLTELVAARLRHARLKGRTITLKLRYADFTTITRSHSLDATTDSTNQIWKIIKGALLHKVKPQKQGIRLLGVGVSQFNTEQINTISQLSLFENADTNYPEKDSSIDKLSDDINQRFGSKALIRGTTVKSRTKSLTAPGPEKASERHKE